jgi:ADP-ribose pyrophosphatase
MQNPPIPIPEVLQSKTVYKNYFEVQEDLLRLPHGAKQTYSFLIMAPEASVVIAETKEGGVVINKEYRHPTKRWLYGLPGGCVDAGESPIDAAKRELLEETGYTAKEFHLLGSSYPFPGSSTQRLHYILAKEAECTHPTAHEPFELIHVEVKSIDFIHEQIHKGAMIDGTLCAALYFRDLFYKTCKNKLC